MNNFSKRTKTIMFLDPGLRECGVSFFDKKGRFISAELVINPVRKERDLVAWEGMGQAVEDSMAIISYNKNLRLVHLCVEIPKYVSGWSDGKVKQLLQLCGVLGNIAARMPTDSFEAVRVTEWKGQTPKEINHDRIQNKFLNKKERLVLAECLSDVKVDLQHNVLDAVGIGLNYFKRDRI